MRHSSAARRGRGGWSATRRGVSSSSRGGCGGKRLVARVERQRTPAPLFGAKSPDVAPRHPGYACWRSMGSDVNEITLREAARCDAAALGRLHVASWHETYTGIVPDEMLAGLSVEKRIAMWSKILGGPEAFDREIVFVVEDGSTMIGFGCCGLQRDRMLAAAGFSGEMSAIYVLRSHQKRGVGRSLVAAMSQTLSKRGHAAASVWVLRENVPARAFYEGLGGAIVGEKRDERPSGTLVEVAYGWPDLACLVRSSNRGSSTMTEAGSNL